MHKLWLVGGGSGQPDYLLPLAKQVLEQADCVIASERFLKLAAGKKQIPMKQLSALLEQLPTLLKPIRQQFWFPETFTLYHLSNGFGTVSRIGTHSNYGDWIACNTGGKVAVNKTQ